MAARAVGFPVGWFGAPLTSGQVLPESAEGDRGGWGGLQPRLPELRRQGSHVMIPVQPIQPERGRLYSLGEEGENRNETKCEHGRGGAILI